MASHKKHVIVVGAGVIGLQTALTLLENGYNVSIVAEHWPDSSMKDGQYTSAWAGAQWRTHAAPGSEAAEWDAETWQHWRMLLKDMEPAECSSIGLFPIKLTEYRAIAPDPATPWWALLSSDFQHVPTESLPEGAVTGMSIPSFVANPAIYLPWLVKRIEELGGRVHRLALPNDQGLNGALVSAKKECENDFSEQPFALVLAIGLSATDLLPGDSVLPVRGQTLLVRGEASELKTKVGINPGEVLAIIPRVGTGTTILGATRGPGRWDLEADDADTKWLLDNGQSLAPELFKDGKAEIINVNVGLRPHRKGGARVDIDKVGSDVVIYSYGHDGSGYQNSVGSAKKVLRLLDEYGRA